MAPRRPPSLWAVGTRPSLRPVPQPCAYDDRARHRPVLGRPLPCSRGAHCVGTTARASRPSPEASDATTAPEMLLRGAGAVTADTATATGGLLFAFVLYPICISPFFKKICNRAKDQLRCSVSFICLLTSDAARPLTYESYASRRLQVRQPPAPRPPRRPVPPSLAHVGRSERQPRRVRSPVLPCDRRCRPSPRSRPPRRLTWAAANARRDAPAPPSSPGTGAAVPRLAHGRRDASPRPLAARTPGGGERERWRTGGFM